MWSGRAVFRRLVGWLIAAAIFYFLARRLYGTWGQLGDYRFEVNLWQVIPSLLALFVYYGLITAIWKFIIHRLGSNLSYKKSVKYWFLSQLGRYLPGKVWCLFGRIYFCDKEGIPRATSVASFVLETLFILISGGLVVFLSLLARVEAGWGWDFIPYLIIVPLGLFIIHPFLFSRLFRFAWRRVEKVEVKIGITYPQALQFVSIYLGLWLLFGLGFFIFVRSIYPLGWDKFLPIVGIYAMAWIAGLLSIVSPGGLGVREGALTLLLAAYLPAPIAIVVALLSRIWVTTAEAICAVVAWRL